MPQEQQKPRPIYGPHEAGCPAYETEHCTCSAAGPFGPDLPTPVHSVSVLLGDELGFELRVPGPGDAWRVIQYGGYRAAGELAGNGSEQLHHLIVTLTEGLRGLQEHEAAMGEIDEAPPREPSAA